MSDNIIIVQDFPQTVNVTETPINVYVNEAGIQGIQGIQGENGTGSVNGGGGVTSINGISGLLFLSGINNIFISRSGETFFISGENLITSQVTGQFASVTNLEFTGSNLFSLINTLNNTTGLFYLNSNPSQFISSGDINSISGALNIRLYDTGNNILSYSNSVFSTITNLQSTGSILNNRIISLSGYTNNFYLSSNPSGFTTGNPNYITRNETGQFANNTNLFLTGQNLQNQIDNKYSNNNPSGFLNSLSGLSIDYVNNISGILSNQINSTGSHLLSLINASSAGVSSLNSQSGTLNLTGAGNISVIVNSQNFIISGDTGEYANFATVSNLFNTGSNLQTQINFINAVTGGLGGGSNISNAITGSGTINYFAKFISPSGIATGTAYFDSNGNINFITNGTYSIGTFGGINNPSSLWCTSSVNGSSFQWNNQGAIFTTANGVVEITNNGANDFGRLMFGGPTSSYPAIKRSGANLALRLADDTNFTNLILKDLSSTGNIYVSGDIYERGSLVLNTIDSGNLLNNINNSGSNLDNKINNLSGYSNNNFYLKSNPSGYITGNSNYITRSETGQFSDKNALFSTGSNLQNQINNLTFWTGNSTGLYYPRFSNPSGYITSGQIGQLSSTPQTPWTGNVDANFYSLSNVYNLSIGEVIEGYEGGIKTILNNDGSAYFADGAVTIDNLGVTIFANSASFNSPVLFSSSIGFFGHVASNRPTVVGLASTIPALKSLITGLASLGLIIDGTT